MIKNKSRRNWLKSSALASLSFPLSSSTYSKINRSFLVDAPKPDQIRLSSNENPYGPSDRAKKAIINSLSVGNRYPNALREQLKEQISIKENQSTDHILLSAGSSEILSMLGHWLTHKKGKYVTVNNTFPILMMCTETYGIKWQKVELNEKYEIDLNRLQDGINDTTEAIYICNPNNPTGTALDQQALEFFCQKLKPHQTVLIDEAYIEYTDGGIKNSMVRLINKHPNVLIIRTFSKIYGLAGLRVGYALGHPELIKELRSQFIIEESCISSAGLSGAIASLKDIDFVKASYLKNKKTKKYITDHFDKWGIPYARSQTNFIYYPIAQFELRGFDFRITMADHNILCPPFKNEINNFSRMTIGTQHEMEKVISVLKKMIS